MKDVIIGALIIFIAVTCDAMNIHRDNDIGYDPSRWGNADISDVVRNKGDGIYLLTTDKKIPTPDYIKENIDYVFYVAGNTFPIKLSRQVTDSRSVDFISVLANEKSLGKDSLGTLITKIQLEKILAGAEKSLR